MNTNNSEKGERAQDNSRAHGGYSFPFGIPLIVYPLLLIGAFKGIAHWWGLIFHGLFLGFVGYFFYQAISYKAYKRIHAQQPTLNRLTWIMNWILFFVLLPVLLWLFMCFPFLVKYLRSGS